MYATNEDYEGERSKCDKRRPRGLGSTESLEMGVGGAGFLSTVG